MIGEGFDMHQRLLQRTVQVHQCGQGCIKLRNGRFVRKRKALFPLTDEDWVLADGNWGQKRTFSSGSRSTIFMTALPSGMHQILSVSHVGA